MACVDSNAPYIKYDCGYFWEFIGSLYPILICTQNFFHFHRIQATIDLLKEICFITDWLYDGNWKTFQIRWFVFEIINSWENSDKCTGVIEASAVLHTNKLLWLNLVPMSAAPNGNTLIRADKTTLEIFSLEPFSLILFQVSRLFIPIHVADTSKIIHTMYTFFVQLVNIFCLQYRKYAVFYAGSFWAIIFSIYL